MFFYLLCCIFFFIVSNYPQDKPYLKKITTAFTQRTSIEISFFCGVVFFSASYFPTALFICFFIVSARCFLLFECLPTLTNRSTNNRLLSSVKYTLMHCSVSIANTLFFINVHLNIWNKCLSYCPLPIYQWSLNTDLNNYVNLKEGP